MSGREEHAWNARPGKFTQGNKIDDGICGEKGVEFVVPDGLCVKHGLRNIRMSRRVRAHHLGEHFVFLFNAFHGQRFFLFLEIGVCVVWARNRVLGLAGCR